MSRTGRPVEAVSLLVCIAGAAWAQPAEPPVMLQWYEQQWNDMERRVPDFFLAGYGSVWLPPVSKAASQQSGGYDVFDRFDLGRPGSPTLYGTEQGFRAVVDELQQANGRVYVDSVLNHNSFRQTSATFQERGGWPGFWMDPESPLRQKFPTDPWGDFHAGVPGGYLQSEDPGGPRYDLFRGDLVALVDIDQTTNHQFIRHPVEPGHPDNIPAGTVHNRPDPANVRFYPDRTQPGQTVVVPPTSRAGSVTLTFYPYTENPDDGVPFMENATGVLMRWTQWMLEVHGVDGFRLDAVKHTYPFFWDQYFDGVMRNRWTTPDGRTATPFSFGESVADNSFVFNNFVRKNDGFGNRDALDLNGAARLRELINAGGFGDWASLENSGGGHIDLIDDGLINGSVGVNHVFSHDNGSVGDGGSMPPLPTDRQMGLFAHAYTLMRPGHTIVYYNARAVQRGFGFFPREGAPIALGFDERAGALDDRITRLVRARNTVARGQYMPLQRDSDVIVFERSSPNNISGGRDGQALVGVNDRFDTGFDTRTVNTSFAPGTRLHEISGTAGDPVVDPTGQIFSVVTVGAGGQATIRVPRNRTGAAEHGQGYVIYAPTLPSGVVEIEPTDGLIPADNPALPAGRRRLAEVPVITADTITLRLRTTQTDPLDPNTDTGAAFRINQGFEDWNGNGQVDFPWFDFGTPGYENFLTTNQPLFSTGGPEGLYEQTIDATRLDEGYHYISVVAFGNRRSGAAPIFNEWRQVIYVDRSGPEVVYLREGEDLTQQVEPIRVRALDRTAERVHVLWGLAAGADPIAASNLTNLATRRDRFDWEFSVVTGPHGPRRLTVVAFEPSGNTSATDFQVFVNKCSVDLSRDGVVDANDFFLFLSLFAAGDSRADFNNDGVIDADDFFAFLAEFAAGCP